MYNITKMYPVLN